MPPNRPAHILQTHPTPTLRPPHPHYQVVRLGLLVLRNVVTDEGSAVRMGGQGAYRIVFAVLQAHTSAENLELVRLGSGVMWRMHHARRGSPLPY